ncbi:mitogen-activated protein kinase kinase kinase 3 isoform X2 [Rhododendron vialii]|uniref:mitogen-activated protein kinase kinase kinase 3 isoform X2 n=1 Tax=Rhododendron vialii TaxID=182163 RepID=UPI00265FE191|nr:mitogen-activated protein kinase kinase kinase 3 isoform X2 [Rhododendron vialii]
MPAWWGKKSSKNKEQQQQKQQQLQPQVHDPIGNKPDLSKSSIKNDNKKVKDKARSCDDLLGTRNSPRNSKDFVTGGGGGGSSGSLGFSGFDSDRAHPLPRPSIYSTQSLGIIDHHGVGVGVVGLGSGSVSVSSCSSGSSDDHNAQTDQAQISNFFRGHGETKLMPVARSPGPGSRGTTTTTSPLHPRFSGSNLESPTGKQEDGKAECHRLPLPPGSPSSSSTLPTTRTCMVIESTQSNFSRWRKGRLLGRGTFGHVYLGFNSEGGHMCAIKEVRVITDDKTSKECLKQLNQGEETLSVYLEYVSGGSIHKLLQEYGPFKEPVIQNYTRQILSGLAYLHGRNTVHRDIKGANILVDPNGEIKLADFGMAKHITACSSMLSFKGSPYWMAPEVVMNTNGYSLPVDIWSLGCTILEMASAKPPWSQFEGVAAIFKIGNSKDIPEIPDHLSNDAKSFLRLCLRRDPSGRPTALQLLDHPFVREQGTPRHSTSNLTKEVSPYLSDGSRTPPTTLELRSNRWNLNFLDGDHLTRPVASTSRAALMSPRDNSARMITSLPVSPSSSPLRQFEPAYRSCFLSPPHPSYALAGQSNYNLHDYSVHPLRHNTTYILDPWRENPQFKTQTPPGGSPRVRQI